MKISAKDSFKKKLLREVLKQLSEEGVVHILRCPKG